MTGEAIEVGMDVLKAQPCPLCGAIGPEPCGRRAAPMAALCPVRRLAVQRPIPRRDPSPPQAPMTLEEMREAYTTPEGA